MLTEATFGDWLRQCRRMLDLTVTTWAMKESGHVARHQGAYSRATELYQAVLEECRVERFAAGVADMLDAQVFEAAWQDSRQMSMEQAIALVQGGYHDHPAVNSEESAG